MSSLSGGCLCQRVRFTAQALCSPIRHCHCTTCRKAHASAYTTSGDVLRSQFRIVHGKDSLKSFESSPGKIRHFCGHCGTHVFAERQGQLHITLRLASLDHDPGQRPAFHVWTADDVDWLAPDCSAYREAHPGI